MSSNLIDDDHSILQNENENESKFIFKCKSCGFLNEFNKSVSSSLSCSLSTQTTTTSNNNDPTTNTSNSSTKKSTKMKFPNGLENFLIEFTVNILKTNPTDFNKFALDYFTNLNKSHDDSTTKHSKESIKISIIPNETCNGSKTDNNHYHHHHDLVHGFNKHESNINNNNSINTNNQNTTVVVISSANNENHDSDANDCTNKTSGCSMSSTDCQINKTNEKNLLGISNKKDEDLEELDEISEFVDRDRLLSTSRRYSVFSKSFDPETYGDICENESDSNHFNSENNITNTNYSSNDEDHNDLNKITNYNNNLNDENNDNNNDNNYSTNLNNLIHSNNGDFEIISNQLYERKFTIKTSEQRDKLKKVLLSIIIFKHLYDEDMEKIISSMFERKCVKDELIIREGDNGNYFYVIISGNYDIYINKNKSVNRKDSVKVANTDYDNHDDDDDDEFKQYGSKVGEYKDKGFFGELALLYNQPRSATIISRDDGILYCMNRDKFQRLVIGSAFKRRKMYEEFLSSVPLLQQSMNDYERSQVADALASRIYKPGECIFKQNDQANGMFFIESGSVKIIQEVTSNGNQSIQLTKLNKGEYFGELALLNKAPRSASAYADDNINNEHSQQCKLAFLDLEAFERLMGPCIEPIKYKIVSYKNL